MGVSGSKGRTGITGSDKKCTGQFWLESETLQIT